MPTLIKDAFTIMWHPDRAAYTVSIPNYEGGRVIPLDAHLQSTAALASGLRSLISTLETIDADERFAAREERRPAHVHTSTIAEAKATLANHGVHL